jgi:hypothetical protein
MKHRCPICHKIAKVSSEEAKFFPFCSQRCKLIDLGAWLDADYKIVSSHKSEEPDVPSDIKFISPDKQ